VAEAADRAHAVELAGLFLEPPDQEHVAERFELLLSGEFRGRTAVGLVLWSACGGFLGCGHGNSGSEKTSALSNPSQTPLERTAAAWRDFHYAALQRGRNFAKPLPPIGQL
jgi:hypothetical protein